LLLQWSLLYHRNFYPKKISTKMAEIHSNKTIMSKKWDRFDFKAFDFKYYSVIKTLFSPAYDFINILHANFTYESLFGSFFYLHVTRDKLSKRCLYEKFARKMLMKLTPVSCWSCMTCKLCAAKKILSLSFQVCFPQL